MKEIIKTQVTAKKAELTACQTDILAVGQFSDTKDVEKSSAELDRKLGGAIKKLIEIGDFKGKEGSTQIIYGNAEIGAKRVMLVGLGDKKKATLDTVRKAAAAAAKKAVELKAGNIALATHRIFGAKFDAVDIGRVMAEGIYFGSYRYDEYVTDKENGRLDSISAEIIETDSAKLRKLSQGVTSGAIIGQAQSCARTIANRPANIINPVELAETAKKMMQGVKGVTVTILDEKQMAAKGMGAILAVGSGSKTPPRFIALKYTPTGKATKTTIGLVGKAITFDSGGIDLKPPTNMDQMKMDKSGGIAVMATVKAAAQMQLPINIYGIIPSAENMPSGSSYRPGDIITTSSGKTIEVDNTDAEGRLVLSDGLAWAVEQGCDVIVDIATLTGACVVALGTHMAGLMSNDDNLTRQLQKAAGNSGEKLWLLPCGDEYADEMKSKIADLKNAGGRWGGACTGAAFLRQFIGEKKWAHLDIAGVDLYEKDMPYAAIGSTGFGVRLLTTYLMDVAKKR